MNVIGKYYETSLRELDNPISEYYIPAASSAMDCKTLSKNFDTLETQLSLWMDRLNAASHAREIAAVSQIIEKQTAKQAAYYNLMQTQCVVITTGGDDTQTTGGDNPALVIPKPTTETKSSNTMLYLLVGLALVLFGKRFIK